MSSQIWQGLVLFVGVTLMIHPFQISDSKLSRFAQAPENWLPVRLRSRRNNYSNQHSGNISIRNWLPVRLRSRRNALLKSVPYRSDRMV
jgi:hypothetical protein